VAGYKIYRRINGSPSTDANIANVTSDYSRSHVDCPGVPDGSTHQYNVTAYDAAGNEGTGSWAPAEGPVPPIPFAPLGTLLPLGGSLGAYAYCRRKLKKR